MSLHQIKCVADDVSESGHYSQFVIGPLYKGQGITLGSSLRRILLSEIEGTAITAAKISGATDDFSSILGIRECPLDIYLNLKEVILSSNSNGPQEGRLHVDGPAQVTAAHLELPPEIKVINPDKYIATVAKDMTLDIELCIEKGKGYQQNQDRHICISTANQFESNLKQIDANFIPISQVKYLVDSLISSREEYDEKLVLEIWSNGSITPHQALRQAAEFLTSIFSPFQDSSFITIRKTNNHQKPVARQVDNSQSTAKISQAAKTINQHQIAVFQNSDFQKGSETESKFESIQESNLEFDHDVQNKTDSSLEDETNSNIISTSEFESNDDYQNIPEEELEITISSIYQDNNSSEEDSRVNGHCFLSNFSKSKPSKKYDHLNNSGELDFMTEEVKSQIKKIDSRTAKILDWTIQYPLLEEESKKKGRGQNNAKSDREEQDLINQRISSVNHHLKELKNKLPEAVSDRIQSYLDDIYDKEISYWQDLLESEKKEKNDIKQTLERQVKKQNNDYCTLNTEHRRLFGEVESLQALNNHLENELHTERTISGELQERVSSAEVREKLSVERAKELDKEAKNLKSRVSDLERANRSIRGERDTLKRERDNQNSQTANLQAELERYRTERQAAYEQAEYLSNLLEEERANYETERRSHEQVVNQYQQQIQDYLSDKNNLQDEKQTLQRELETYQRLNDESGQQLQVLSHQISSQLETVSAQVSNRLVAEAAATLTNNTDFATLASAIETLHETQTTLRAIHPAATSLIQQLSQEPERLNAQLAERERHLQDLRATRSNLEQEISQLRDQCSQQQQTICNLTNRVDELERISTEVEVIPSLREKASNLEGQLSVYQGQLEETQAKLENLQSANQELQHQYQEVLQQKEKISGELESCQQDLNQARSPQGILNCFAPKNWTKKS